MLSRFFLDRPVFAWVIAIAMMLGGGLAIYNLPISQYPPIAPPSISIRAVYPGAAAKTPSTVKVPWGGGKDMPAAAAKLTLPLS